jgi:catalase
MAGIDEDLLVFHLKFLGRECFMTFRRYVFASAIAGLLVTGPAVETRADADPEALVDALNAVFGKHPGKRSGHANCFCVKGSFTPTAAAAGLSKAPHLSGKGPWPVVGRFSMGGGNPAAPNTDKGNARGLALHFDLGGGSVTDMVVISAPVFVAKTPEKFLDFLQRVASKDQAKIDGFFEENPESKNQGAWLKARPVPASYATVSYFGVHTFTLTNADGKSQIIKWKFTPKGGEAGLSDEEAKAKDADFYRPELAERLAKGLSAILGEPGDATDDPTALWPEQRESVKVGDLSISALEDDATCDAGVFDPTNVVDGIAGPENDGIFQLRSPAYAISFSRRTQ